MINEQELRQQIIDACKFLQEKNLIARTWENVSAHHEALSNCETGTAAKEAAVF